MMSFQIQLTVGMTCNSNDKTRYVVVFNVTIEHSHMSKEINKQQQQQQQQQQENTTQYRCRSGLTL
jgi:hypothetical protein